MAELRERAEGPTSTGSFVGRESEIDIVARFLLDRARLVTLLGPGGIGKTRLAAEVAQRLYRSRQTPVHWVRLGRLDRGSSAATIVEEVARKVVETDYSGRSSWKALLDALKGEDPCNRDQQTIIVMDNCEHVLADAGLVIAQLLEAVPHLNVLATSREPVGWLNEQLVHIPYLSPQHALSLFQQRAELTGHPIQGDDQLTMAAQICRHMDNSPLYIQLAAGRLVRQPLAMVLQQLTEIHDDRRLRWQHATPLGTEERHTSINEVVSWSYDLCSEPEQLLFDRMSVFAAGYDTHVDDSIDSAHDVGADLEAIETVCGNSGSRPADSEAWLPAEEIDELLDQLVSRSLVTRHLTTTSVRYSLSENLRVFAHQRLSERSTDTQDEPARLAERHRAYYRDKALYAAAHYFGPDEQEHLDWARASWANILAAIETSLATPSAATVGLEICAGLLVLRLPFYQGSFREMRKWTERALAATRKTDNPPVELTVMTTALLVWITLCQGQPKDAERMLEDCVAMCLPDVFDWRSTPESDLGLPAAVEFAWGAELLLAQGNPSSITVFGRAHEKFAQAGDRGSATLSELFAALSAGMTGSAEQALGLSKRYLEKVLDSGSSWVVSWARLTRVVALTRFGDPAQALELQRTALAFQLATRDQWGGLWAVEFRGWALAHIIERMVAAGQVDRGTITALATETAYITGGTQALRAQLGVDINQLGPFGDATTHARQVARNVLGDKTFSSLEEQGSRLRPDRSEVQQLAMGTLPLHQRGASATAKFDMSERWGSLTSVEQEVAILAAAGWTNSEIAARRGKSRRTVDAQIATVLQKLEIASRVDIARFAPEERLEGEARPART